MKCTCYQADWIVGPDETHSRSCPYSKLADGDPIVVNPKVFTGGKARLFVNGKELDLGNADISFTQKCTCGADKTGVPFHSSWCDKDKTQEIPLLDDGPIEFHMQATDQAVKDLKEWMEKLRAEIFEINRIPADMLKMPPPKIDSDPAEIRYDYGMIPVPLPPAVIPISSIIGDDE